jgi:hypothetical protein
VGGRQDETQSPLPYRLEADHQLKGLSGLGQLTHAQGHLLGGGTQRKCPLKTESMSRCQKVSESKALGYFGTGPFDFSKVPPQEIPKWSGNSTCFRNPRRHSDKSCLGLQTSSSRGPKEEHR